MPESKGKFFSNGDDVFVSLCVIEDLMHGHSHARSPLPSGARADCDTPERCEGDEAR